MTKCFWCERDKTTRPVTLPKVIIDDLRAKDEPEIANPVNLCGQCEEFFLTEEDASGESK